LRLQTSDLILAISIDIMPQLQEQFNNTLCDLKDITDIKTLIDQINKLTNVIKEYNKNYDPNDSYQFKKEMENIRERYQQIQVNLSNIQSQTTEKLQDLIGELKYLFDTLTNLLHLQHEKIVQLESKVETLETSRTETENNLVILKQQMQEQEKKVQQHEKKFKLQEKLKLIGDLLQPLFQVGPAA
jgi:chromosome segregation ATPase